jgi:hypothetical protein
MKSLRECEGNLFVIITLPFCIAGKVQAETQGLQYLEVRHRRRRQERKPRRGSQERAEGSLRQAKEGFRQERVGSVNNPKRTGPGQQRGMGLAGWNFTRKRKVDQVNSVVKSSRETPWVTRQLCFQGQKHLCTVRGW